MKKCICLVLTMILLLSCGLTAYAVEEGREFHFALSVDGKDTKEVQQGDIITVAFHLQRTDSQEDYTMYAMQNEIRYDSSFFKLVEGSAMLSSGISSTDIGLRDSNREFYMNYVSMSGGEMWNAKRLVGSFQLEVIGTSGVSKITNQDYLVSTSDGKASYKADCQDVTIVLSTECTVTFQTNGGTELPALKVQYGEKLTRPEDPIRAGYHVEGWYTDLDMKNLWDFETDVVQGNMTLYAKWAEGDPVTEKSGGLWWILLLILALLGIAAAVLALLLGKKTVHFETNSKTEIPDQKVKRGEKVQRPEQPKRNGRMFGGWYVDEECTERWDFENDTVEDSMTLYAKWM